MIALHRNKIEAIIQNSTADTTKLRKNDSGNRQVLRPFHIIIFKKHIDFKLYICYIPLS